MEKKEAKLKRRGKIKAGNNAARKVVEKSKAKRRARIVHRGHFGLPPEGELKQMGEITKAAINFMLAVCPSLRTIQMPVESPKVTDVQDETDIGAM